MRCLITGAGGFIGSHLCEELVSIGYKVTAFIRYNSRGDIGNLKFLPPEILEKINIIKGDITDRSSLEVAIKKQDILFHLAALIGIPYSYITPGSYISINVGGTLNVLEAAKRFKIKKVIHTSTSEVYGSALYTPVDEEHPLCGQSPYSASKIGADQLAESYYRSFDLPITVVRPFNTFGPRQSARAIIPTIICQLLTGVKNIKLGALDTVRDFNYIEDTVSGFIKIAQSPQSIGKVFNIGSGVGYSIKQIVNKINRLLGLNSKIIIEKGRLRPKRSEVKRLICDYSLVKKLAGYEPKWSFENGLRKTIEFIRGNIDLYDIKEYTV